MSVIYQTTITRIGQSAKEALGVNWANIAIRSRRSAA